MVIRQQVELCKQNFFGSQQVRSPIASLGICVPTPESTAARHDLWPPPMMRIHDTTLLRLENRLGPESPVTTYRLLLIPWGERLN